jgi:aryl-alcohol dehydrogenase-like predicted oxidoreductase
MRSSVETSLRALRTDYLDALLLHEPMPEDACRADVLELMHALQEEGKIRRFGIAAEPEVTADLLQSAHFAVVQVASDLSRDNILYARGDQDKATFFVTHSVIAKHLQPLHSLLERNEDARTAAIHYGIDPDPGELARRLLALSLRHNPDGVVLFSARSAEKIVSSIGAAKLPPSDVEQFEAFFQRFQRAAR